MRTTKMVFWAAAMLLVGCADDLASPQSDPVEELDMSFSLLDAETDALVAVDAGMEPEDAGGPDVSTEADMSSDDAGLDAEAVEDFRQNKASKNIGSFFRKRIAARYLSSE